jgi:hypothetical protein
VGASKVYDASKREASLLTYLIVAVVAIVVWEVVRRSWTSKEDVEKKKIEDDTILDVDKAPNYAKVFEFDNEWVHGTRGQSVTLELASVGVYRDYVTLVYQPSSEAERQTLSGIFTSRRS